MNLRVFALALALVALAPAGLVTTTGFITAEMHSIDVEQAVFVWQGIDSLFPTPGWNVQPAETSSYEFPVFIEFPQEVRLTAWIDGAPVNEFFFNVRRDEWQQFLPPYEDVWVMFTAPPGGVEKGRVAEPRARFSVVPNVIRESAVIRSPVPGRLEVFDAAGNAVRTLAVDGTARWAADDDAGRRLAEGVYFCRLVTDEGSSVRKVLVAQ